MVAGRRAIIEIDPGFPTSGNGDWSSKEQRSFGFVGIELLIFVELGQDARVLYLVKFAGDEPVPGHRTREVTKIIEQARKGDLAEIFEGICQSEFPKHRFVPPQGSIEQN
jgi:hypothetical protein